MNQCSQWSPWLNEFKIASKLLIDKTGISYL
jgi:hypothetical protein